MPIEIPELGDDRHRLWCDLIDMAAEFPDRWTTIGAHMVALHAWEAGVTASRPSDDVDVLVNVRLAVNGTEEITRFLRSRDHEPEISTLWPRRSRQASVAGSGLTRISATCTTHIGTRSNQPTQSMPR